MSRVVLALTLFGCTSTHTSPEVPCPDASSAAVTIDAAPVNIPPEAPCDTYEQLLDQQQIVMVRPGYEVLIARMPFVPLIGAGDSVLGNTRTLVYAPQLAGDRLGAIGRTDPNDPLHCAWEDAATY